MGVPEALYLPRVCVCVCVCVVLPLQLKECCKALVQLAKEQYITVIATGAQYNTHTHTQTRQIATR